MPKSRHSRKGVARRRGRCPIHATATMNGRCDQCRVQRMTPIARATKNQEAAAHEMIARHVFNAEARAQHRRSFLSRLFGGLFGGRAA